MSIEIPKYFGLAVIDVVLYGFLLQWMAVQVSMARNKYNVKLPAAYENKEDSVFNRYQRAHQNTLESAAIFLALLLLSALQTPISSAIAGFVYILGRYTYAKGYYADIKKRQYGSFGYFGFYYLLGGTIFFAYKLLSS